MTPSAPERLAIMDAVYNLTLLDVQAWHPVTEPVFGLAGERQEVLELNLGKHAVGVKVYAVVRRGEVLHFGFQLDGEPYLSVEADHVQLETELGVLVNETALLIEELISEKERMVARTYARKVLKALGKNDAEVDEVQGVSSE